jgi:hypothetical protein
LRYLNGRGPVTRFWHRKHGALSGFAKRHGLQNPKDAHDWQMAEKARMLYKKADAAGLAALIFESMLIGPAGSATVNKEDHLLTDTASHYKVDTKALRIAVGKTEKDKAQKKNKLGSAKEKSTPKTKTVRK